MPPALDSDDSSQGSGASSDCEEAPYADLICFGSSIRWVTDPAGVKWPVYDRLTNKELKDILSHCKMPTLGKKELLIRRLENKDKRTHAYRESLVQAGLTRPGKKDQVPDWYNANLENFIGNIDATRQRSSSAHSTSSAAAAAAKSRSIASASSKRSKSVPPSCHHSSKPSSPINVDVESASSDEDSCRMEVDQDAVEMFPQSTAEGSAEFRRGTRQNELHQQLWASCSAECMQRSSSVDAHQERSARSHSAEGA
jgi:hypothetical protein